MTFFQYIHLVIFFNLHFKTILSIDLSPNCMCMFAGVSGEPFGVVDKTYIHTFRISSLVFRNTIIALRIVSILLKNTHFSSILAQSAAEGSCCDCILRSKRGR
jgi:hypothetical protein